MNTYKGTKTEENLRAALAGESMARNKYSYFALAARAEGYDDIAEAFERLARNEMTHAKFWFEALHGKSANTVENLVTAAKGEYDEWYSMYPDFAKQARADGFEDIAIMFEHVASIERNHEGQFMQLFAGIASGAKEVPPVREMPKTVEREGYRCMFCGATFEKRLDVCNVCHAIGSFELCKYEVEQK